MPRYVLLNAVPGLRAGTILDTDEGQNPALATSIGGKLILLPNSAAESAAIDAAKAYARGAGDEIATGIMLAATSGATGSPNIAWSPAGNGNARTFDEVGALVEASKTPPQIYLVDGVPGQHVIYDVGSLDMKGGKVVSGPGDASAKTFRIANGAQVRNLGTTIFGDASFTGGLTCETTTTGSGPSPLAWDSSEGDGHFAAFSLASGALLVTSGDVPSIIVPPAAPDSLLVFILSGNASLGGGATPAIRLEAGANLFHATTLNVIGSYFANWLEADGTNFIGVLADGFDFSLIAGWPLAAGATFINQPMSMDGGTGPTAYRPLGAIVPLRLGSRYYDQEVGPPALPIFWDGAQFTDALGTPVP